MWFALKMAFRESYQKIPITFMLNTNFSAITAIYINARKRHQACKSENSDAVANRNFWLSLLKLGYSQLSQIFRTAVSTWGSASSHIIALVTQSSLSVEIWKYCIVCY